MMLVLHHDAVEETTLRWFLSLCETENMRDTAALLRINQSSLSRALGRLEKDLGVQLFRRNGRRLSLNRFGALLRDHATRAVADLEAARLRIAEQIDPQTGLVRLGFLQSVGRWMVPEVVRRYREVAPAAQVELRQGFARDLFGWLRDDVIDAALVTPPPASEHDIDWAGLREQQLCLAVPPGHPLADRAELTLADVHRAPFVAFALSTDLRHVVDDMLRTAGVQPAVTFESAEIETMRGLVSAGLGVAVLPRPEREERDDLVYRTLTPARSRELGVAWIAPSARTPAVRHFLETVLPGVP